MAGRNWIIDSEGRNVVERNRAGRVVSDARNGGGKETGFNCGVVYRQRRQECSRRRYQVLLRAKRIVSDGRNMVEGNWVQLRTGKFVSEGRNAGGEETVFGCDLERSTAQTGSKSAEKLGLGAGWYINSESRNLVKGNRVQLRSLAKARTEAAKKPVSAAGWKGRSCCELESSSASARTALEIGIGCSSERSPRRTGSTTSLTRVHFSQDQNCE